MVLVAASALIISIVILSYRLPPVLWPRALRTFITSILYRGGARSGSSGTDDAVVGISRHPDAPPMLVTAARRAGTRQQAPSNSNKYKSGSNSVGDTSRREGNSLEQIRPRVLNSLNRSTPAPGVPILKMGDLKETDLDGDETPKASPVAPAIALEVPSLSLGSEEEVEGHTHNTLEPQDATKKLGASIATSSSMPPPPPKRPASSLMPPPSIRPSSLRPLPRANAPSPSPPRGPSTGQTASNTSSGLRVPSSGASRPGLAPNNLAASARGPPNPSSLDPSSAASSSTLAPAARPSKKVILAPGHSPLDWASLCRQPPSATFLRGADVPPNRLVKVSPTQLRHYNGRKGRDAWGTYQGKVYNLTPYRNYHPGGPGELFRGAGRAGETERLFREVHPWVNWDAMLSECMVGVLVGEGEGEGESGAVGTGAKNGGLDLEAVD